MLFTTSEPCQKYKELNKKYTYIDSHDKLWHSTLGALAQLTNNTEDNCKCWYCECDGSFGFSFHVDHFRPKKRVKNKGYEEEQCEPGYWWMAFNPQNYRIACQKCNSGAGKNDQFPLADRSPRAISIGGNDGIREEIVLLLDPIEPNDPDLLVFSQDGNVQASLSCLDDDRQRVEVSIAVYDLRARSKRIGRRIVWQECMQNILNARKTRDRLKESILQSPDIKQQRTREFKEIIAKIKRMTLRNAKFSMTAKSCIREYYKIEKTKMQLPNSDLDWLIDLL